MTTLRFILVLLGAGIVVFFVIAVIASCLLNRAARHWMAQETGDEEVITAAAYSKQALRRARKRGIDAGFRGHPLTACPYHQADEPLAAEWRTGHTLALLKQRHGVGRERPRMLMVDETRLRQAATAQQQTGGSTHGEDAGKNRRRTNGS